MRLANLTAKQLRVIIFTVLGALIAEFFTLEGTIGISMPSDRYRATSNLEIKATGLERHFITRNTRFTVVEPLTNHGSSVETLVLREYFFTDREPDVEGPQKATITVEAMTGGKLKWTFREPGEQGDVLTNNVYRVKTFGSGETPNVYTYFSLLDGRKVRTANAELSRDELIALDGSVLK